MMEILICGTIADEYRKYINLDNVTFENTEEPKNIEKYDVILTNRISKESIKKAKNLKWIQSSWAGVNLIFDKVPKDVLITRTVGAASKDIARYVSSYVLYFSENIKARQERAEKKIWDDSEIARSFENRNVGVIGFGVIGEDIAKMLNALGFNVNVLKKTKAENIPDFVNKIYYEKEKLIKISDYIVLTLPKTKDTEDFLSDKEFRMMKKNAVLINIGRGNSINEQALMDALNNDFIKAAVIDVFNQEPLPEEHGFWDTKNILLTPHIAGPYNFEKRAEFFMENIKRFRNNEKLIGLIDREKGY